jgi:hypothetical protein
VLEVEREGRQPGQKFWYPRAQRVGVIGSLLINKLIVSINVFVAKRFTFSNIIFIPIYISQYKIFISIFYKNLREIDSSINSA